jgi:SAM-dependent methyltransferase
MPAYGAFAERMLSETSGTRLTAAEPSVLGALQARLDELLADTGRPVHVLDAGCGKNRAIPIAQDRYVVGIDISEHELERNPALDETIVGDVQSCQLNESRFDAVLCWNVLEHLPHPESALLNLTTTLRPGGVMILAVPHVHSVKGLVTRFTPLWFHRWTWRQLMDDKTDVEPFPTVMSPAIAPRRLRAFAREHGLTVEFFCEYEGWEQKKLRSKLRLTGASFRALQLLVGAISAGIATATVTDAVIVMRKPADQRAAK